MSAWAEGVAWADGYDGGASPPAAAGWRRYTGADYALRNPTAKLVSGPVIGADGFIEVTIAAGTTLLLQDGVSLLWPMLDPAGNRVRFGDRAWIAQSRVVFDAAAMPGDPTDCYAQTFIADGTAAIGKHFGGGLVFATAGRFARATTNVAANTAATGGAAFQGVWTMEWFAAAAAAKRCLEVLTYAADAAGLGVAANSAPQTYNDAIPTGDAYFGIAFGRVAATAGNVTIRARAELLCSLVASTATDAV